MTLPMVSCTFSVATTPLILVYFISYITSSLIIDLTRVETINDSIDSNRLLVLNVRTFTWRSLGTSTSTGGPSARISACLDYDPVNNRFLLFGGKTFSGTYFDDIWYYTKTAADGSGTWQRQLSSGPMSARSTLACSINVQTGVFYIHGGKVSSNSYASDSWVFSPSSRSWTELSTTAISMYGHRMKHVESLDVLYIFFGYRGSTSCTHLPSST
jgi:hypothetical protein